MYDAYADTLCATALSEAYLRRGESGRLMIEPRHPKRPGDIGRTGVDILFGVARDIGVEKVCHSLIGEFSSGNVKWKKGRLGLQGVCFNSRSGGGTFAAPSHSCIPPLDPPWALLPPTSLVLLDRFGLAALVELLRTLGDTCLDAMERLATGLSEGDPACLGVLLSTIRGCAGSSNA